MAKSHPDISVVIPVYNVASSLRACLDSVVGQTVPGIEVVAVDDGSTDGSAALLHEYQRRYPDRVKVITTGNRGANHARNTALKQLTGEYVVFVDSDDFIEPDMCGKLLARAVHGRNDIVFCGAYNLYDNPRTGSQIREATGTRLVNQDFRLTDAKYEFVHLSPFPWAKLFRRSVLAGLEFPELTSFQGNDGQYADLVFVLQACCRATRIGVVDEPLYNYHRTTVRGFSRRTLDVVRAFDLLTEYMRRNGHLDTFREELEYVCAMHFAHRYPRLFKRRGNLALKLEFISATHGFLDREFPGWRRNSYLRRSPRTVRSLLGLYSSATRMTRMVHAREHVPDFAAGLVARRLDQVNVFADLY